MRVAALLALWRLAHLAAATTGTVVVSSGNTLKVNNIFAAHTFVIFCHSEGALLTKH
jgi:hypothetical protein